jgi:hypothetical protein
MARSTIAVVCARVFLLDVAFFALAPLVSRRQDVCLHGSSAWILDIRLEFLIHSISLMPSLREQRDCAGYAHAR